MFLLSVELELLCGVYIRPVVAVLVWCDSNLGVSGQIFDSLSVEKFYILASG